VTAEDLGLPLLRGARLSHQRRGDAAFDLGFTYGEKEFRLRGVSYVADDLPSDVLEFYRRPLLRYGEVLECEHGRAVGSLTRTSSGLTCDSHDRGDIHLDAVPSASDDHELRAGSPQAFRIVALDDTASPTKFVLLFVEIPTSQK